MNTLKRYIRGVRSPALFVFFGTRGRSIQNFCAQKIAALSGKAIHHVVRFLGVDLDRSEAFAMPTPLLNEDEGNRQVRFLATPSKEVMEHAVDVLPIKVQPKVSIPALEKDLGGGQVKFVSQVAFKAEERSLIEQIVRTIYELGSDDALRKAERAEIRVIEPAEVMCLFVCPLGGSVGSFSLEWVVDSAIPAIREIASGVRITTILVTSM